MAQVATPLSGRAQALFTSVFAGPQMPRTRNENKVAKPTVDPASVRKDLERGLKPLLGIETSGCYAYGLDGPTAEGQPFRIPISKCQPMQHVRRPNQADRLQQRSRLLKSSIWQTLRNQTLQLGSSTVKKIVAEVLDRLLREYVRWAYSGCYRSDIAAHLEFWIQYVFIGLVNTCLEVFDNTLNTASAPRNGEVDLADLKRWHDIAMTHLGALRVDQLLDMIMTWDEDVNGIHDLRHFTTSPATRSYLTTHFTEALSARLLHPGSSTIEILHHYVSIIRAFRKLDPKGVLLDRVARRVRKYLKDRDNTVAVIVGGLLSDPFDANGQPMPYDSGTLTELALELSRRDEDNGTVDDNELDWDNMNWVPDPIDAAPDYTKSKNTDVVGSLTSLFESKDIFVKELQNTLADRLLKNKPNFELEVGVIKHLETRFGESTLQGCEVMLRDVSDSRNVDEVIRKEQGQQHGSDEPALHAKILSRLFWPTMTDQNFNLPTPILDQQASYEKGFETLKQSRKLTWLNSIGHVEVELHLEDRTITEEVLPYQATVIYAFESQSSPLSIAELASRLEMSPTLVRSACIFWLSRRVLTEPSKDHFLVLETLPSDAHPTDAAGDIDTSMRNYTATSQPQPDPSVAAAAAAAESTALNAQKEAEESARKSRMALYHQFIISMLTNQGAMPLPRIAMMLGIVVPGGFPFSNEELKDFLGGMVKEGAVEVGMGGNYRAVA